MEIKEISYSHAANIARVMETEIALGHTPLNKQVIQAQLKTMLKLSKELSNDELTYIELTHVLAKTLTMCYALSVSTTDFNVGLLVESSALVIRDETYDRKSAIMAVNEMVDTLVKTSNTHYAELCIAHIVAMIICISLYAGIDLQKAYDNLQDVAATLYDKTKEDGERTLALYEEEGLICELVQRTTSTGTCYLVLHSCNYIHKGVHYHTHQWLKSFKRVPPTYTQVIPANNCF